MAGDIRSQPPAVLYTPQTLTSAQSGQVMTNLSGTLGCGESLSMANNQGFRFLDSAGVEQGHIWGDDAHPNEIHYESKKSHAFLATDGSINGLIIQLGNAGGTAGTDYVYSPRQGVASGGNTLVNSQFYMWNSAYWDGADIVYTGFNLRSTALDTSGNVAAEIRADNTNGNVTTSAQLRVPVGSSSLCGYAFAGDGDMGLYKDSSTLGIQSSSSNRIQLQTGVVNCSARDSGTDLRIRAGFFTGVSDAAFQIYYSECGLGIVSRTEWFATVYDGVSAGTKIFSVLTAGFQVEDGKNIILATGTGTKIGTATGQKLAFWNQTPVVQQVLATGAGATVDNVISLLQTLGLCKQS